MTLAPPQRWSTLAREHEKKPTYVSTDQKLTDSYAQSYISIEMLNEGVTARSNSQLVWKMKNLRRNEFTNRLIAESLRARTIYLSVGLIGTLH